MRGRGFTLVEMMVVVVIFSLIALFLTNYLVTERKDHESYELQLQTRNNVLSAINIIAHDLRMCGSDPALTGTFGFLFQDNSGNFTTDHTHMLFRSDLDPDPSKCGDGNWNPVSETFGFYLNGTTIMRPSLDFNKNWTPNSDQPLVSDITNLTFNYHIWDEHIPGIIVVPNPTEDQLKDCIAVEVTVTGQSPRPLPTNNQIYTFTAQSLVKIRPEHWGG